MSPPSPPIQVATVIVTYNSAATLPGCIEALPAAFEGVERWQLVVVDNDSADATLSLTRELSPDARIVEMGWNSGYAAAINRGVAEAPEADCILILNPDVRMARGSVGELIAALERPSVGIAVPRLSHASGQLQLSLRREPTTLRAAAEAVLGDRASRVGHMGEIVGDRHQYLAEHPVDWATGAAMLVSRACFDKVGPWDETFFLYSEETDFCLRARDAGLLTWFTPSAEAIHIGGESNTNPYLWSLLTVNRVRAFRKRHGALASSAYWLAITAGEALRAAVGRPTHRAGLRALLVPGSVKHPQPRAT